MFKGFAVIDFLRSLRRQSAGANRAVGQVGKALWVLGLSAGFTAMCVGLPSCDWMVDEEVEVEILEDEEENAQSFKAKDKQEIIDDLFGGEDE